MNDNTTNTVKPIMKSLSRLISPEELTSVSGAGTKIRTPSAGTATEETYSKGSTTPTQLDTIVETP